jgi:NAD(P)-dependent dehydrogenase (short-subunit alcohol dehydrogenase family)
VLDVNLMGVVHGCRLFGRAMVDRGEGGHIVNTASAAAFDSTMTPTATQRPPSRRRCRSR